MVMPTKDFKVVVGMGAVFARIVRAPMTVGTDDL